MSAAAAKVALEEEVVPLKAGAQVNFDFVLSHSLFDWAEQTRLFFFRCGDLCTTGLGSSRRGSC